VFAQVIRGTTTDREAVRVAAEQWLRDLAPGAAGWLGSTVGVTDDGRVVAVARFESAEAAERNSGRPEQGRWWEETSHLFGDEPVFMDSTDVDVETVGDPDRAGFVQVVQGRTTDPARARALMASVPLETMKEHRPDILGTLLITHDDGWWTQVVYFTSEAEAREHERREPPPEWRATLQELMGLNDGEVDYLDLRDPVLHAPR
jgi:hypothetical protein